MGLFSLMFVMMNLKFTFLLLATLTVGINCASTGAEVEVARRVTRSPTRSPTSCPPTCTTCPTCQTCPCEITVGSCSIKPEDDCTDSTDIESCSFNCATNQANQDLCDAVACKWASTITTGSCSNIPAVTSTHNYSPSFNNFHLNGGQQTTTDLQAAKAKANDADDLIALIASQDKSKGKSESKAGWTCW